MKKVTKLPRIYRIWAGMKSRCNNLNCKDYPYYGGRGISYSKKWETFKGFKEDMGSTYKDKLTLDRINNNKNYSKSNCRWVSRKVQANNSRQCHTLTFKDRKLNITQWATLLGRSTSGIKYRLNLGWPIEKILTPKI